MVHAKSYNMKINYTRIYNSDVFMSEYYVPNISG